MGWESESKTLGRKRIFQVAHAKNAIRLALGKVIEFLWGEIEKKTGAGKEIRTPDPRLGKAMLYH